jgi:hypothetical protein
MVGDLIPGQADWVLFFQNDAQTVDSSVAIMVAIESFTTFDTTDHKMMQDIGVSWGGENCTNLSKNFNFFCSDYYTITLKFIWLCEKGTKTGLNEFTYIFTTPGDNYYGQTNVGSWSGITQVAVGYDHTVGRKSNGTVVAVGNNCCGKTDVGAWSAISQVAANGYHTVGLKFNGTVVAVGSDYYGMTDVGSWTGIVKITAGPDHTVGIKADGSVVATGKNDDNQCNLFDWNLYGEKNDTDGDGIPDRVEAVSCTDRLDADTDDDGLADGVEDANRNGIRNPGETDPCNLDTDGDGIQDGTERGIIKPVADPDGAGPLRGTNQALFIPDGDSSTTTDPLKVDTDGDRYPDNREDLNRNGRLDEGESDPSDKLDIPKVRNPALPAIMQLLLE